MAAETARVVAGFIGDYPNHTQVSASLLRFYFLVLAPDSRLKMLSTCKDVDVGLVSSLLRFSVAIVSNRNPMV